MYRNLGKHIFQNNKLIEIEHSVMQKRKRCKIFNTDIFTNQNYVWNYYPLVNGLPLISSPESENSGTI